MKKIILFIVVFLGIYLSPKINAQPVISMAGVNNVQYDRATFSAVLTDKAGWTINGYGFVYDTVSPPTRKTGAKIKQISPSSPVVNVQFNSTPTLPAELMTSGKTYYIRAYVKRSSPSPDTAYSDILQTYIPFPSFPILDSKPATNIGLSTAVMNGSITAINDAPSILSKGFVYDSLPNPTLKSGKTIFKVGNITSYPYDMNHSLTFLSEGQDFFYRTFCIVKFNNRSQNDTIYSDTVKFTTNHTCDIIPFNIVVDEIDITSVRVKWSKGFNQSQWEIDYGLVGHAVGTGTSVTSSNDSITINGLQGGKAYTLYIRAKCPDRFSDWSEQIPFTTLPPLCPPSSNISTVDVFHSSAILTWTPGSMLQDTWEVQFTLRNSAYPSNTTIVKDKPPRFYPVGLQPVTGYKMRVRAVCGEGTLSEWTDDYYFNTKPASIEDIDSNNIDFDIFPNPSKDIVNFKSNDNNINLIEIWNSLGEIIYSNNKIPESYSFTNHGKGMYLIRIHSNNKIKTKKVIIQ
ncbi:MAG: fibronectin type III domain-containing protein [Bacteroidales bacterium]